MALSGKKRGKRLSREQVDKLTSFVDVLNEHGPDSREAKAFQDGCSGDPILIEYLGAAVQAHREFHPQVVGSDALI